VKASASQSVATDNFFIDGNSNYTFYSSSYFSGGSDCLDVNITYEVSDPGKAFSGGL